MALLDDIVQKVGTLSTGWTAGTNMFAGQIPISAPNMSIAVIETGGVPTQRTFGGVAYERPSFQILVRSTSYQTGRTNSETIYQSLDAIRNSTTVSSTGPRYVSVVAQQAPFPIGRDDKDRWLFSCNYRVEKEQ